LNRKQNLSPSQIAFYEQLKGLHGHLDTSFLKELNRSVSFGDVFVDRWERASKLGFGENTSIYDSSLVIGDVKVGSNCWIGPYTILDGSGKLILGDFCTISAGVHIYTHDNVKSTLTSGKIPIERKSVALGNNTYVAPNVIISKGVTIGSYCIIGAGSFVNKSFENFSIIGGVPAKQMGIVKIENDSVQFEYFK
jgi:acetyltransferase-like isoleucine patch superfamily enzyme